MYHRIDKAKKTLRKAAKVNGHELTEAEISRFGLKEVKAKDEDEAREKQVKMSDLFSNGCMRKRLAVMVVSWITVVLCYSGLTLNRYNLDSRLLVQSRRYIPRYRMKISINDKLRTVPLLPVRRDLLRV